MSAFIVSPGTMNRVLHAFQTDAYGATKTEQVPDPNQLAAELYDLNAAAMDARYEDRWHRASEVPTFRYRPSLYSLPELAKAVTCLLYQCSEGDVPERALYKRLEAVRARLYSVIVQRMPAYDAAPWDTDDFSPARGA